MHLPKTAGTSLTHFLKSQFSEENICPVHTSGDLTKISEFARRKYKFYAGHFSFSDFDTDIGSIDFITILRDPLQRVLSHYYFWQQTAETLDKMGQPRPEHLKNILELPAVDYLEKNWSAPLHLSLIHI